MGTTRKTTPQAITVEWTVTGSLDGTTPAPEVDIDPTSENATPFDVKNQICRPPAVESLGLIDPDLLIGGSIGVRCIPFLSIDAPGAAGAPGAAIEIVGVRDGSDGDVFLQKEVAPLAGVAAPVFLDEGFNVPQGSDIRLDGYVAADEPIRVRVTVLVPESVTDIAAFRCPCPTPGPPPPPVGGGPGWFLDAIWVDAENDDPGADGSMLNPLPTIQGAVDLAEARMDALPPMTDPDAPEGTRNRQRQVIVVAGGIYDEDVSSLRGNMFIEFLACGPVVLGDAAVGTPDAGLFDSTVPRSFTWFNDQTVEDADAPGAVTSEDDRRPQFVLGVFPQMGESSSTHTAIASSWKISGGLIFTTGVVTTCEVHLQNVQLMGALDGSADAGIRNCYVYRCKFEALDWDNANFQVVESTEFDGPTALATYGRMVHCEIDGGFTVAGYAPGLPPGGMFGCDISGTFTGPAGSLVLDAATNYYFVTNGAALGGGATKVLLHDLTP